MRLSFLASDTYGTDRLLACQRLMGHAADLAVLPELFFTGEDLTPVASDGPLPTDLRQMCAAADRALLFGYEEACSGEIFNSAQMINAGGAAIANYRCTHPSKAHHGTGRWLTVVPFGGHRIGLLIGDDLFAPEVWRSLALSEVSCILWTGGALNESSWLLRTRARENGVTVVGADRAQLHAFDPHGQPIDIELLNVVQVVTVGRRQPIGLPLKRQPILYRRLVSEAQEPPL